MWNWLESPEKSLFLLFLCALTTQQIVDVFRHGSIYEVFMQREFLRARREHGSRLRRNVAIAITCGFCLSHWVALFLIVMLTICPHLILPMLVWFSTVKLAQLSNDLLHPWSRLPARNWGYTEEDLENNAPEVTELKEGEDV